MHALLRTLGGVKGLALTALIVLPVSAATVASTGTHPGPTGSVTAALAGATLPGLRPAAGAVLPQCHGTGALVLTRAGRIEQVSLARGLRTYQHKAPGTFVALCPAPSADTPQGS